MGWGAGWVVQGHKTYLAGVSSSISSTQHVIMDNKNIVPCGEASVVLPITEAIFHDGHLHLLQGIRWRERLWGEISAAFGESSTLTSPGNPCPPSIVRAG